MAFKTPISIREVVEGIHQRRYVLPAIQREFLWTTDQITRLFDSLMRGYPIGSFLFWRVDAKSCDKYQFYNFLANYHERDEKHNSPASITGEQGVTAILDGQQRLTSLYIGLRGTYASKTKHKRRDRDDAFPRRRLYVDLGQPISGEEVELRYDFRFLTKEEAKDKDKNWFLVKRILEFENLSDINAYLRKHNLIKPRYPEKVLTRLLFAIRHETLINYYEEDDQSLDKVLNIFIRVNSGGTELGYSDLLLSIATAQWKKIDAREEVLNLVDDLNRTGSGFGFNKDFVLKACLVLADVKNIGFRVGNFTRQNMVVIEGLWQRISASLRLAVELVDRFGYDSLTLTSTNALVPVAYYLFIRELPDTFVDRSESAEDREAIRGWIVRALLSGTFGGASDTTLSAARETIRVAISNAGKYPSFPQSQLDDRLSVRFDEEDIDFLLTKKYSSREAFSILAILYPWVDFSNKFHQDHIFPRAQFSRGRLHRAGVREDDHAGLQERRDQLPNLQLIEGVRNQVKSSKLPSVWAKEEFRTDDDLENWKSRNFVGFLPENLGGFEEFFEDRLKLMKRRLMKELVRRRPQRRSPAVKRSASPSSRTRE